MNRSLRSPAPLPLDVRLMNRVSGLFMLVIVFMLVVFAGAWLMRSAMFELTAIEVQGEHQHNNAATLRAHVAPALAGNFFMMDLARARAAFESVPWVRRAVVRREFPNRLKVSLQEHKPVAFWGAEGETRLVNNFGEVFEVNQGDVESEDLPVLNGPAGQASLVLLTYQALLPLFGQLDAVMEKLELTSQASWRARLDSGAVIDMGHGSTDEITARTQRFITTLGQVSSRYGRDLESADLRYSTGYAIKLRGVTTGAAGEKEDRKVKR
jgi:cell division protein FtsQ